MVNKRAKTVIILALCFLGLLIVVGIVQSVVLTYNHNRLDNLTEINIQLKNEKQEKEQEHQDQKDYILNPDGTISEKYKDDYKRHNPEIDEDATGEDVDDETITVRIG